MLTFLYGIQIFTALILIALVMFQRSEGGTGLISSNAYNSFFGNKSLVSNPLTRITIIFGFIFFLNSILIGATLIYNNKKASGVLKQIEQLQSEEATQQNSDDVPLAN